MSSTVTTTCYPAAVPPMLPSIGEDEIFGGAAAAAESASVMILPATPAQVIPVSSSGGGGSGAIKTYISVYNGEEEYVAVP